MCVMEPVLRTVYRSLGPFGELRAYADDIGVVVRNYTVVLGEDGKLTLGQEPLAELTDELRRLVDNTDEIKDFEGMLLE